MATELQPRALGRPLAETPKVFGLFTAELGSAWPDEGGIPALLVLRHKCPDQPRPCSIPGGGAAALTSSDAQG